MLAEIITIGTELITGKTVDSHSSYLSRECYQLGIEVIFHTSVRDHPEQLCNAIMVASNRVDLVFLCGGLGPTLDDLTKETLSDALKIPLVPNQQVRDRLKQWFSKGVAIPENNDKQAYVFQNGTVFFNDNGTAPGLVVSKDSITYVLLPGPPSELIPMFETSVRPFLSQKYLSDQVILTHSLSFFGMGESFLEDQLIDLMTSQGGNPSLALYAQEAEVILRITAKANDYNLAVSQLQRVRDIILNRLDHFCFSQSEQKLEEIVIEELHKKKYSLAISESCTGGLLSHLLSTVPGSSGELKGGIVCYTNFTKRNIVGVPEEILSKYGAISPETAKSLAEQTLQHFSSDFSISITGVAGPSGAEGKPIGLVYIGLACKNSFTRVFQFNFRGSRQRIQLFSAKYALYILLQRLKKGEL